jgi:threonine/homoserine/homoserine lactone efflux protein
MNSYWLFTTIWFVAAATPGADTMLLLSTSLSTGWKSAIPISLGITAAKIVLLTLTFFGLTALINAAPVILVVLKIFGCAFLLWRAFKLWQTKVNTNTVSKAGFWQNLSLAFTVAVSNPQALLFYVAVVPQVSENTSPWLLNAIIAIGFTLISAIYVGLATPIGAWIARGGNQRLLNRGVALVFVGLAIILAVR